MSPKLYNKITKLLKEKKIQSLTLDVFDTILLYGYWPTDLRYYDIAVRWLPTIHHYISKDITTYELYDRRMEAKRAIDAEHLSSRIDIWLDIMIDGLCSKYNVELDENIMLEILTTLMAIELEFEMENVRPNTPLIKQIAKLKTEFPKLKVYFIADSPFMSEQISMILGVHEVNIFDGGVSSADYNKTKASGELYEQLVREFGPNFDLSKNLHMGDQRGPDFLAPSQHDSLAIHYRPIRMRGLRTMVGNTWLKTLQLCATLRAHHKICQNSSGIWQTLGHVLSEIYQAWACQIQDLARLHDNETVLLAGEDTVQLASTSRILQNNELALVAPNFIKIKVLRALIWFLAASQTNHWDAARLLQLFAQQENLSRETLYQLCFTADYEYIPLAVNSFTDAEFYAKFLGELLNADQKYTADIRESYKTIASYLPQNEKTLFIIQLYDDNVAELFHYFAELHLVNNPIDFIALDDQNFVHEQQAGLFRLVNPRREQYILDSLASHAATRSELSAETNLTKVLLPKFQKLTHKILRNLAA